MKRRAYLILPALLASLLLAGGCFAPKVFIKSVNPNWNTVAVSPDRTYDRSWETAVDYLLKRFDMEVLSREDGYMRTHWSHTWTGEFTPDYRVRVALKFSPDRKTLEIKTEAEKGGEGAWVKGYDTRLRDAVLADLTAAVGTSSATGGTP